MNNLGQTPNYFPWSQYRRWSEHKNILVSQIGTPLLQGCSVGLSSTGEEQSSNRAFLTDAAQQGPVLYKLPYRSIL